MSAGYNLNEGKYEQDIITDDEIWAKFAYLFSNKSKKNTSYKFGFLKSILDNLYNTDADLYFTFDQLFSKFTEIYWNLILKYGIKQRRDKTASSLEKILYEIVASNETIKEVPYESLPSKLIFEINKKVKKNCKKYVVGAVYGDLDGYIYSFSIKDEYIQLNPIIYTFLCKNKTIIEKINYYEWAKFLESTNANSVNLLTKIDKSTERSNLSYYRNILFEEFENKCFYCAKTLNDSNVHVDHFIPWSFIKDDNLWNFVLSCNDCNKNKRDKLPKKIYLDTLINRNKSISVTKYSDMKYYNEERLKSIYQFAQNNGYELWNNKR